MKTFKLPYCAECGGARVAHAPEKISLAVEDAISFVFGADRSRALERTADRLFAHLFTPARSNALVDLLVASGLGSLRAYEPGTNTRALALKEGADAANVSLRTFSLFGLFMSHCAERGGERVYFRLIPRPRGARSPAFYFMDNKERLKEHLVAAGIPTARGGAVRTNAAAQKLFRDIGRPVITKPHVGSRGRHTTIDIRDGAGLERGFKIAKQLSPKVIVEQYLKGVVHRVTLVGGEPVAVAKREYPYVIGDGTHTITELIDIENQNPRRDGIFFRKLEKTERLADVLSEQGYTSEDIPPLGTSVTVNDKNSRLNGTVTDDVTDIVHPENTALFRRLAEVLDDPIVGVDFMIEDMARPWSEQPDAGVIECNSMPYIDVHHKVASGTPRNVGKLLWETVFRSGIQ